jgi:hypothetical protein
LKSFADYSSQELNLLKDLARWGRSSQIFGKPRNPLIVLTGRELFSDHGIRRAWQDDAGNASTFVQHAAIDLTDLYQLAESTQQLYLGLPPFYADFHEIHLQRTRLVRALAPRSKYYCVSIG